jgi:hypothetical protein
MPNSMTSNPMKNEQTREEFITACVADGTERGVCEARWDVAHQTNPDVAPPASSSAATGPPPVGDADLMRELEMTKAKLKLREDQLRQAIDIANTANERDKAKQAAEREYAITQIVMDSDGKWTRDELKDKNMRELNLIRTTQDKTLNHTFATVAALQAEVDRKKKTYLTAGYFDPATQTWKGGI